MLNDILHAFRLLIRSPGFTIVACLTLALGIGANAAIFSVADAAMFKPLPYKDADRLVDVITEVRHPNGDETGMVGVSGQRVADLRAMTSIFDGVEVYGYSRPMPLGNGSEQSLRIGFLTPAFPAFLGVSAQLGRTFTSDDVAAGTSIVISDGYWRRGLGGDRNVLGKTIPFADRTCVVIGVMRPTFRYYAGLDTDGWLPLDERKGGRLVARLQRGLTFDQAQLDLNAVVARATGVAAESFEKGQQWRLELKHGDWNRGDGTVRTMLLSLLGAVGFLLLVACANVGNLLIARTLTRQREIAVRTSLGATRLQLVRQFVIEGLTLAGLGGLGAVLLAWWGVRVIPTMVPARMTYSLFAAHVPQLDVRVLSVAVAAALITGIFCGLAPAFRASRATSAGQRVAGGSRGQRRVLNAFQAIQVAMTMVLLLGAGLLVASLVRMITAPDGFESERLAFAYVNLPQKSYASATQRSAFFDDLVIRVRSLAGVQTATAAPTPISSFSGRFSIEGRDMTADRPSLDVFYVGEDYFKVARIPVISGRTFGPSDGASTPPVVLISENAEKRFWPGRSALGRQVRTGPISPPLTIIGVVGHVKTVHFTSNGIELYKPLGKDDAPSSLLIRLNGDGAAVFAGLKAQVAAMDPAVRITRMGMVDDIAVDADPMGPSRFFARLMGLFAGLGLLTAAIGLYGLLSHAVGRRTHEIGVRIALGASISRVRWLVLAGAMMPVAAGVVMGLAASIWLTKYVESQLYQVKPHDPMTYIVVVSFLVAACALAALAPAQRATRVDPIEALRTD